MEGLRPEDRTHKVNHDEEVNAKAQERFESGYEGEKADLFGEKQDWDDTDTVLAHKIIVNEVAKARESGSKDAYAEVAKLMKEWDAHGTEAGQALRQRRQLASDPALMEADAIQLLNDSERTRKMSGEQRKKILDSVSQNAEKMRSIGKGDVDGVVDLIKDMNKAEIYDLLRTHGIWHEITEHKAVYNMAELTGVALPYPDATPKICSCATIKSAITTSSPSAATSASTSRNSGTDTAPARCRSRPKTTSCRCWGSFPAP